jgi:DNA helicase-2/ATP-dependent DNA helicase PcrA
MCRQPDQSPERTRPADLTPSQWTAVDRVSGPLLVLAGPGSGKTRVITRRIARMVDRGIDARRILAITFTNKAAKEMASRVAELLPGRHVWVSTFHRFCARLLRERAAAVGLSPNFSIYDTADQLQVIRQVLHRLDLDMVHYPPARIAARISRAKNDGQSAEQYIQAFDQSVGDHIQGVVAKVFPVYQQGLLESNAVDFDDLLLHVATLLCENPELRSQLDERFQYVLVDEYQDTNLAQYRILAALSQDHANLCVTGDPDQSIYGWRGAQIDNILRFETDFPKAAVVRLEENFRSTKQIVRAASTLIAFNTLRKEKALVTENDEGEAVELLTYRDAGDEAEQIAHRIRQLAESGGGAFADVAVVYRVNALSREIEIALARHGIPYQLAAGVAFYDRTEIKDMLAYLRVLNNPDDRNALLRIVNKPARGIGKRTLSRLSEWADTNGSSLRDALTRAGDHPDLSKRAKKALAGFVQLMRALDEAATGSVEQLLGTIIERTSYTADWLGSELEQDRQRLANIHELVSAASQYDLASGGEGTLEEFLEETSLVNEIDNVDETAGRVTLMTLHAAKGLEFSVVFVVAVEQDLIPHERALRTEDLRELEEERRLLFVGMTRAQERLYLTRARVRQVRGRAMPTIPSSFLSELKPVITYQEEDSEEGESQLPAQSVGERTVETGERPAAAAVDASLVMTAADLLNGTRKTAEIPTGFAAGMTVRHPRYGLGTIISVSGMSRNQTLTVEFHGDGKQKTFVASKSPLQPVGLD